VIFCNIILTSSFKSQNKNENKIENKNKNKIIKVYYFNFNTTVLVGHPKDTDPTTWFEATKYIDQA